MKETIAVWFSCGAASAVAAKMTVEKYGDTHDILVVNTPIAEEHPDNLRFKKDVSDWIGMSIHEAIAIDYPDSSINSVFKKRKYISGVAGAPCTKFLKKQARYEFELSCKIDCHVFGFTFDEISRHERFIKYERSNVMSVLIDAKITKQQCFEILHREGIKLPEIYQLGFPNANCIGCVKSSSPAYWNLVRQKFPEVFDDRAKLSREIGCKLVKVKGERIYLDELNPKTKGGKIQSWECGLFCDTD